MWTCMLMPDVNRWTRSGPLVIGSPRLMLNVNRVWDYIEISRLSSASLSHSQLPVIKSGFHPNAAQFQTKFPEIHHVCLFHERMWGRSDVFYFALFRWTCHSMTLSRIFVWLMHQHFHLHQAVSGTFRIVTLMNRCFVSSLTGLEPHNGNLHVYKNWD